MDDSELIDYIAKNVKPFGFQKYPSYITADGIALPDYSTKSQLEDAEKRLKNLQNHVAIVDKVLNGDLSKINLRYVDDYIGYPDSDLPNLYQFSYPIWKPNPTSQEILHEAEIRAEKVKKWEEVEKEIAERLK